MIPLNITRKKQQVIQRDTDVGGVVVVDKILAEDFPWKAQSTGLKTPTPILIVYANSLTTFVVLTNITGVCPRKDLNNLEAKDLAGDKIEIEVILTLQINKIITNFGENYPNKVYDMIFLLLHDISNNTLLLIFVYNTLCILTCIQLKLYQHSLNFQTILLH